MIGNSEDGLAIHRRAAPNKASPAKPSAANKPNSPSLGAPNKPNSPGPSAPNKANFGVFGLTTRAGMKDRDNWPGAWHRPAPPLAATRSAASRDASAPNKANFGQARRYKQSQLSESRRVKQTQFARAQCAEQSQFRRFWAENEGRDEKMQVSALISGAALHLWVNADISAPVNQ